MLSGKIAVHAPMAQLHDHSAATLLCGLTECTQARRVDAFPLGALMGGYPFWPNEQSIAFIGLRRARSRVMAIAVGSPNPIVSVIVPDAHVWKTKQLVPAAGIGRYHNACTDFKNEMMRCRMI